MVTSVSTRGSGVYFTNSIEKPQTPGSYFTEGGKEPPGTWHFAGTPEQKRQIEQTLGLVNGKTFDADDIVAFTHLCKGYNPKLCDGKKSNPQAAMVQNAAKAYVLTKENMEAEEIEEAAEIANGGKSKGAKKRRARVALTDVTFSPPKSFSAIVSQMDEKLAARQEHLHGEAVKEAVDFLAQFAVSRTGAQGKGKPEPVGLVCANWGHYSSRENDPQVHCHSTLLNIGIRADGTTGSLETVGMMKWQGAVSSLYHSSHAWKLRNEGFAIRMEGSIFAVEGVPVPVCQAFSKRSEQLKAAVEAKQTERGITAPDIKKASRKERNVQALETRLDKSSLTRQQLSEQWIQEGKALGFTREEALACMQMGEPVQELTAGELLEEARMAVATITETEAVFTLPKLLAEIAVHLCGRASVPQILDAYKAIQQELVLTQVAKEHKIDAEQLNGPPTEGMLNAARTTEERRLRVGEEPALGQVDLTKFTEVRKWLDKHAAFTGATLGKTIKGPEPELETYYTTKEMLAIEFDLITRVTVKAKQTLDPALVDREIKSREAEIRAAAIADIEADDLKQAELQGRAAKRGKVRGPRNVDPDRVKGLEDEQVAAIWHACTANTSTVCVEGTAGAGKTFAATTVAAIHKAAGFEVAGLSQAWAQAINLQQETEGRIAYGRAIAGWLNDLRSGKLTLTAKSCVILDEAGMVGSRQLREVVKATTNAGARLVLMGDTEQQNSVSAGDGLRLITGVIGSARLDIVRRQSQESHRNSVKLFFGGAAKEALVPYQDNLHVCQNEADTMQRVIADWQASRQANPLAADPKKNSHLVLAYSNRQVKTLNRLAHEVRDAAGELGERRMRLQTMDSEYAEDLVTFAEGDQVVFRANQRGLSTTDAVGQDLNAAYSKALALLDQLGPDEQRAQLELMAEKAHKIVHRDAQEIAARIDQLMAYASGPLDRVVIGDLHKHQAELLDRLKAEEATRAKDVFNRVRGVIETVSEKDGTMIVRTEGGGLVKIDVADPRWHQKADAAAGKRGGLALQHGYATTVAASQGLTRGRVFVLDHTGLDRRSAGVAMSRHREECNVYVDKESRYLAMTRHQMVEEQTLLEDFSDEICLGRLATAWSRQSDKLSTPDFTKWRDADGLAVHAHEELLYARMRETVTARPKGELLPLQKAASYELPYGKAPDSIATMTALTEVGINPEVMQEATRRGFLAYRPDAVDRTAADIYLGRDDLSRDGRVVNAVDGGGKRDPGPLRHTFPPVLHGDNPSRVVIAPTGQDALAIWTQCDQAGQPRPTVLVIDSPEQLHPRTAQVIAKAQSVDVTRSPKAGLVAERARALSPTSEVRETTQEPAREAARQAELERARIAAEELALKNELQRGR